MIWIFNRPGLCSGHNVNFNLTSKHLFDIIEVFRRTAKRAGIACGVRVPYGSTVKQEVGIQIFRSKTDMYIKAFVLVYHPYMRG
jgi:hypothetical protein